MRLEGTDASRAGVQGAGAPRGHGTIEYRLDVFGIDPAGRRAALRFYQERFDIPDE